MMTGAGWNTRTQNSIVLLEFLTHSFKHFINRSIPVFILFVDAIFVQYYTIYEPSRSIVEESYCTCSGRECCGQAACKQSMRGFHNFLALDIESTLNLKLTWAFR